MDGRPLVRFLYIENAKGDKPLVTDQFGNVLEGDYPGLKDGKLGQILFVDRQKNGENTYKPDYILSLARSALSTPILQSMLQNTNIKDPIFFEDKIYAFDPNTNSWKIYTNPADVFDLGRFVYDQTRGKLYYVQPPNGQLLEIATGGGKDSATSVITCEAKTKILIGQLCCMTSDGRVEPANKDSGKAVGYALEEASAGYQVRIQVGGVFENYSRCALTPGKVYYQGNRGEIDLIDNPVTYKHPAGLAVSTNSLIILTEIYMGTGGGGGTVNISGITVVRKTKILSGEGGSLGQQAMHLRTVMAEMLGGAAWFSQPYMLKQILTIENTDPVATLQFSIKDSNGQGVVDLLPKSEKLTIPVQSTDWSLNIRGEYKVSLTIEIISGALGLKTVTDPTQIPPGSQSQVYTDPKDGKTKYVILGVVKRFEVKSTDSILFDFPKWISATIGSEDYMILGSLRLKNTASEAKEVKVLQGEKELYTFSIVPGTETVVDLHREDVSFISIEPGSIQATANLQVTAYVFK